MAKKKNRKKAPKPTGTTQPPGFQGSVVHSPFDALAAASGVKGAQQVWFPQTKVDVATAVVRSHGQRTFIRSGWQAASTNSVDPAGRGRDPPRRS